MACYRIGLKLIKALYPQYAPLLHHLRDVNTRTLGVPLSWIYKILLRLPEQATREELCELLPDEDPDEAYPLEALFATHRSPQPTACIPFAAWCCTAWPSASAAGALPRRSRRTASPRSGA